VTHDHHHDEEVGLPRKREPRGLPSKRQLYYRELHAKVKAIASTEHPRHCPRCKSARIEEHDTRTWRGVGKWFVYYFPLSLGIFLYPIYLMWDWGSNNVFGAARETAKLPFTKPHFVCHECGFFWLVEGHDEQTD
jgi:hypothetical protein